MNVQFNQWVVGLEGPSARLLLPPPFHSSFSRKTLLLQPCKGVRPWHLLHGQLFPFTVFFFLSVLFVSLGFYYLFHYLWLFWKRKIIFCSWPLNGSKLRGERHHPLIHRKISDIVKLFLFLDLKVRVCFEVKLLKPDF